MPPSLIRKCNSRIGDSLRKQAGLGLATAALSDLAIDIGGTSWSIGIWSSGQADLVAGGPTRDPSSTLRGIFAHLRDVAAVERVGVAFPGSLDAAGTVTAWPNRPEWIGTPLVNALLQSPLGRVAVRCKDDGFCAAVGEARLGVGLGLADQLTLVLGTGLGGAIVIGGELRSARQWDARTVGHVRALGQDRACRCGRSGCLQLALAQLPDEERLHADPGAWSDGLRLVEVVADVLALLGIEHVILCGGLLRRSALRAFLTTAFELQGVTVRVPDRPELSSLLGALVWEELS